jgi:hypothetical protein
LFPYPELALCESISKALRELKAVLAENHQITSFVALLVQLRFFLREKEERNELGESLAEEGG